MPVRVKPPQKLLSLYFTRKLVVSFTMLRMDHLVQCLVGNVYKVYMEGFIKRAWVYLATRKSSWVHIGGKVHAQWILPGSWADSKSSNWPEPCFDSTVGRWKSVKQTKPEKNFKFKLTALRQEFFKKKLEIWFFCETLIMKNVWNQTQYFEIVSEGL